MIDYVAPFNNRIKTETFPDIMGPINRPLSGKGALVPFMSGRPSARELDPSKRRKSSLCSPEISMNPRIF